MEDCEHIWRQSLAVYSIAATIIHTGDEIAHRFWDYTTDNFRVKRLREPIGLVMFLAFGSILSLVGCEGYSQGSDFFLCGLIGARLSDWMGSHVLLRLTWSGPNPGLQTSFLYLVEIVLVGLFAATSGVNIQWSMAGFAIGYGIFASFWLSAIAWTFARGKLFRLNKM